MFLVFKVNTKFVKINFNHKADIGSMIKYSLTNLNNATYFTDKKQARSWKYAIVNKYPVAELVEAELKIKE